MAKVAEHVRTKHKVHTNTDTIANYLRKKSKSS